LGDVVEAERFLEGIEARTHEVAGVLAEKIRHPVLAGLLLAEASIAGQRNIRFDFHPDCEIDGLPTALTDAQAVTIVGNLLDNAFDAVAEMSDERRRVEILLAQNDEVTAISVRDWGSGLHTPLDDPFRRGETTKTDHPGVGLALLLDAVTAAMGRVDVTSHEDGTTFYVEIPAL
jgi:two-component system cit operon sensor histidine kinase CitA